MRPPSGDRLMLIAGPRRTSTSSARASSPSATPTSRIRSRSQLDPMAAPGGKQVAGRLSLSPRLSAEPSCRRTPCGPSVRTRERMPSPSRVDQKSRPVSSAAFAASSASSSAVGSGAVTHVERHLLPGRHRREPALQIGEHVLRVRKHPGDLAGRDRVLAAEPGRHLVGGLGHVLGDDADQHGHRLGVVDEVAQRRVHRDHGALDRVDLERLGEGVGAVPDLMAGPGREHDLGGRTHRDAHREPQLAVVERPGARRVAVRGPAGERMPRSGRAAAAAGAIRRRR